MTPRELIRKLLDYELDEEIKFYAVDRRDGLIVEKIEYKGMYLSSIMRDGFHPDIVLDTKTQNKLI